MSMPFFNQKFTFTQPDGTQFDVVGTGDQHNAIFETPEGYTVVRDPVSGFFHYGKVSADGDALLPTGIRPGAADPGRIGLEAGARPSRVALRAGALASPGLPRSPSRWEVRRNQRRMALQETRAGIAPAPPQRQTVGTYVGLCLLVQFPDVPGTITRDEVDAFCNQSGYGDFGNNGSVSDYFRDISDGKLSYTNFVAPYYTAKYSRSYYTNEAIEQPLRAWELIKEALAYHLSAGLDFSKLTVDDQQYVYALNVFYSGVRVNNWAKGLWPHSYHLQTPYALGHGKLAYDYQITDIGNDLSLGTFCHENGHMICDFPDLYDYGYESNGAGVYCLMCAGGSGGSQKNPSQVDAYLKHSAGWTSATQNLTPGSTVALRAGHNEFAIHRKNSTEYYIIENRIAAGRDAGLPDAGLTVWHVDELGSNNNEQRLPSLHYECAVVQADGRNDLENGVNNGNGTDLFQKGENDRFSDTTLPNSKWWDGTASGLDIRDISVAGATMTFSTGSGQVAKPVGPKVTSRSKGADRGPVYSKVNRNEGDSEVIVGQEGKAEDEAEVFKIGQQQFLLRGTSGSPESIVQQAIGRPVAHNMTIGGQSALANGTSGASTFPLRTAPGRPVGYDVIPGAQHLATNSGDRPTGKGQLVGETKRIS
jgi:M6 family metalloprotease-like protein